MEPMPKVGALALLLASCPLAWSLAGSPGRAHALPRAGAPGIVAATPPVEAQAGARSPAVEPRIGALAWLAGTWSRSEGGVYSEESWLDGRGRMMLGLHRDVREEDDRTRSFEYLRIEEREDGLVYVASPGGRGATEFALAELSEERVVFENPEHDFPRRVAYWIDDEDRLAARVEGARGRAVEWRWTRAAR